MGEERVTLSSCLQEQLAKVFNMLLWSPNLWTTCPWVSFVTKHNAPIFNSCFKRFLYSFPVHSLPTHFSLIQRSHIYIYIYICIYIHYIHTSVFKTFRRHNAKTLQFSRMTSYIDIDAAVQNSTITVKIVRKRAHFLRVALQNTTDPFNGKW